MEQQRPSQPHPPLNSINGSASTSSNTSDPPLQEDGNNEQQQSSSNSVFYRVNISISDVASDQMRDDVWSCLAVLATFWFFASMTMILGFFGSMNLKLGPNCSFLITTNHFFVQSINAELIDGSKPGPLLYGFDEPPPLDTDITWTQTHNPFIAMDHHKEWVFFLNEGSKVDISYNVKSTIAFPLSLVIAQGRESLAEWIDDPSYPNTTLSWNIIYGSGKIQQEIFRPASYYIAVGNLNSEEVEVELNFTIKAIIYDTTQAYYRCALNNRLCRIKLLMLGTTVAVLTSPTPEEAAADGGDWYVKFSFGPRWIIYIAGSGITTALILLLFRFCNMFQPSHRTEYQQADGGTDQTDQQAPLLTHKDDDGSSWDSSYDSLSQNEDLDEWFAANCVDGKSFAEGENPRRLCVICFDAPRDSFFLPCGHCAACFTCGTRIAEEAGNCPICRRSMKKVRKIFNV